MLKLLIRFRFKTTRTPNEVNLVEIPEEKEFAPRRSGRCHVTEQVGVWIPKNAIETQNDFVQIAETQTRDCRLRIKRVDG